MPQTGILKLLKKFGKTIGNVLEDINDNIYKPLKHVIECTINSVPFGGYINKELKYGINILDTYVLYKQGKVNSRKTKKPISYYNNDEDDNRNDFGRYYK